jgi:cholesterol transport system auxiliary component
MKGRRLLALVPCAGVLVIVAGACSLSPSAPPPTLYDLGPATAGTAPVGAPATIRVHAPPWLDSSGFVYRLEYRDAAQIATYRDSRWAAPPAELLAERMRQQAARASRAPRAAHLRIDVEEFCQAFSTPERSRAVVRMRAALVDAAGGRLLGQRTFTAEVDAQSADAAGGAHALARAAQEMVDSVLSWAASASD